ncbi:hypothetical protein ACTXT7_005195 [Hymenolepis weldensis]
MVKNEKLKGFIHPRTILDFIVNETVLLFSGGKFSELQNGLRELYETDIIFQLHGILEAIIESKPVLKLKAAGKTENGNLLSKPKANMVFCFRRPKQTLRTKGKEKGRCQKWHAKKAESCN